MRNTEDDIVIVGARENNLKDVSLRLPKSRITVFTGVSGSGKSSVLFEDLGAVGRRDHDDVVPGSKPSISDRS